MWRVHAEIGGQLKGKIMAFELFTQKRLMGVLALVLLALFFVSSVSVYAQGGMEGDLGTGSYDSTSGTIQASIGATVSITIDNYFDWQSLSQNLENAQSENELSITISPTTNVVTDTALAGSDNLNNGKAGDQYDEILIENITVSDTGEGRGSGTGGTIGGSTMNLDNDGPGSDDVLDPWMDNTAAPSAGSPTEVTTYGYLDSKANQKAGTYTGTLYILTRESDL